MAYQTFFVHVDADAQCATRVRLALQLAARQGGHVIGGAPSGISRFLYHNLPPEQDDPTLALHLDMQREQARAALAAFDSQCADARHEHVTWEARLIDDEAGAGISLSSRSADLAIISQAGPDARALAADLPPHVITHAGRPVLIVPASHHVASVARRILVSWDGGREAAHALQLALPLLRDADQVSIAVFEVSGSQHTLADAIAADPRPWLERHGIRAALSVHAVDHHLRLSRRNEVGERLLAVARDGHHDLLVMGAYGHSRFREAVLGGVTRTVLEEAALPVLMAH